jgi:hypothetical protein
MTFTISHPDGSETTEKIDDREELSHKSQMAHFAYDQIPSEWYITRTEFNGVLMQDHGAPPGLQDADWSTFEVRDRLGQKLTVHAVREENTDAYRTMKILAYEKARPDVLKAALDRLFPDAEIHLEQRHTMVPLEDEDWDFVVTEMVMPTDETPKTHDYAGVSVMLRAQRRGIPAVCMSADDKQDQSVSFGTHLLLEAGMAMVHRVDKKKPMGWISALQETFPGGYEQWAARPKAFIAHRIQQYAAEKAK